MCHRVMPKDGINTATATMLAINPSILYRKTGTTTYTYRITTVSTITPMDNTMIQADSTMTMARVTAHNETMNHIDILLKAIKTDATITAIMAMAMTNIEASKTMGVMAKKKTIEAIGRIDQQFEASGLETAAVFLT